MRCLPRPGTRAASPVIPVATARATVVTAFEPVCAAALHPCHRSDPSTRSDRADTELAIAGCAGLSGEHPICSKARLIVTWCRWPLRSYARSASVRRAEASARPFASRPRMSTSAGGNVAPSRTRRRLFRRATTPPRRATSIPPPRHAVVLVRIRRSRRTARSKTAAPFLAHLECRDPFPWAKTPFSYSPVPSGSLDQCPVRRDVPGLDVGVGPQVDLVRRVTRRVALDWLVTSRGGGRDGAHDHRGEGSRWASDVGPERSNAHARCKTSQRQDTQLVRDDRFDVHGPAR